MNIKIWIITGNMNAGGAESLIMEILRNKVPDADVRLIIHSSNGDYSGMYDKEIAELEIPVYHLPSVGSVGIRKYTACFKKLIEEIGIPDVVHIHLNAVSGIIARAAKKCGVHCRIIHCHADITFTGSMVSKVKNELLLLLMKIFVNIYGTHFWACSEAAASRLFYKNKDYTIIPNIIDTVRYSNSKEKRSTERKRLGIDDSIQAIGAIGRIAPIKNYEVIIKAIAEKCCILSELFIYGRRQDESYCLELEHLIEELGLKDRIHFLGNCDRIPDAIAAFDVFVMPSISEGLGIAALEAQAAGLPTFISEGVPDAAIVIPSLVKKISTCDASEWAKAIVSAKKDNISNENILKAFKDKHFDSKSECMEIYRLYGEYERKNQE